MKEILEKKLKQFKARDQIGFIYSTEEEKFNVASSFIKIGLDRGEKCYYLVNGEEGKTNIIPDEVKLEGIIRTFDEDWREEIKTQIRKISSGIAESMGGSCEVFIDPGYPALENDDMLTANAREYAIEFLGERRVFDLEMRMTAEDFSYYAREIPGCFFRLGTRNEEQGITSNLHSATFDIDETSIETGMGIMAWFAICELSLEDK